jgi:hypothetical protein
LRVTITKDAITIDTDAQQLVAIVQLIVITPHRLVILANVEIKVKATIADEKQAAVE